MLSTLKQLITDVDGAWAAAISGLDGLLVESHSATDVDLSLLVAEHAGLMRATSQAYSQTLSGGQTRELYIRAERLSIYLHPVGQEYFLMLAIDGRSNLGQARLYGRDAAHRLEAEL
ncbi:roadblock/LC7 domain-containing protein [Deinococcus sonorensis]|uniref:Roadblock/LC7 domain-containing protein n=2 Tax=Deinococcus sonorensis TaxID=309891 RepID=A0AAU7UBI2_9DEIO